VESGRDRPSGERPKATSRAIDRTSYEPAYVQLVNILRHDITAGVYQTSDEPPRKRSCAPPTMSARGVRLIREAVAAGRRSRRRSAT